MKYQRLSPRQNLAMTWWNRPGFDVYDGIICDGSIRSGKTVAMTVGFILWAMSRFKGQNFALCGKTIESLRRNVTSNLPTWLAGVFSFKEHRTENKIVVSAAGRSNNFYLFGGKDESSAALIQGITLAGILLDEVALMPESFVNQATARCSVNGSKLWFNCNPEGPSHWFYQGWVLKVRKRKLLHLHFTMDDNLSLFAATKARYENMYSGVFYDRYIRGLWVVAEGLVYTMFNKALFGYSYDHPKMWALREIFLHATTVYCYRMGLGASKASNDYATAKYPGVRGNDINIVIAANVDEPELWDVTTYLDGIAQDTQTVATAEDLVGNTWVDFKKAATLEGTAGAPLEGGSDVESVTGDSHQAFLDKIEAYAFNALCCPAADPTIVKLYATYTQRMRDEVGAKFQLIAWQPSTVDYEGTIGVWNTATHPTIEGVDEQAVVYWTTGAQAGVAVNKSLTNAKYDGELVLNTEYNNAQYTAALKAGKFMFYNDNGTTRILEDINTLVTLSDTKGEDFQSCQTMRVCDQIANDVAVLFGTRYLGTVQNNKSGRSSFWGDIVHYMGDLEKIRAVENFDPDTVSCEQGDKKKAVLLIMNGLNIVNAMAQLYMSVIIK